jgi:hypothetical protein
MEIDKKSFLELQNDLETDFDAVYNGILAVKNKLLKYADGKTLKGDEIVGWYGEICCRQLTNGKLVPDNLEYDVITQEGYKISVKTRKGKNSGWKTTSAIPKIEIDDESPTHLMFIHLLEDYSIDKIWLLDWDELHRNQRFIEHKVRGSKRSYVVRINPEMDKKYLIYPEV